MKKDTLEQRLREYSDEELIQLILTMSENDPAVRKLLAGLTAPTTSQVKVVRRAIKRLGSPPSGHRYIRSGEMARMIGDVLLQIDTVTDRSPGDGWVLLCELMAQEENIHGHVDDSSGIVSSEYYSEIIPRLVQLSQTLADPKPLTEGLRILCRNDAFGTVASSLYEIACYLPEGVVETVLSELASRPLAPMQFGGYRYDSNVKMQQEIYRSIGDTQAYIELTEATVGLSEGDYLALATIRMDEGDVQGAKAYLDKVSKDSSILYSQASDVYKRYLELSGDSVAREEYLRFLIEQRHDIEAVRQYHDHFGNEALQSILDDLLQKEIAGDVGLFPNPAGSLLVLIAGGRASDVARVVGSVSFWDRSSGLRGYTGEWELVAHKLSAAGYHVEGSLILRRLLTIIMAQGKVSTYRYAANLFKVLDQEAEQIADWGPHVHHDRFMEKFAETHSRKYKFWELVTF